ncbi:MAG: CdaR family protein [Candidatus Alcyoniella australis]|nr:CdaR family protein [Candidatus Alcyoniella australis]
MVAIRKKIFENLHLKLLSLLFALILYLMVSMGEGQDVIEVTRQLKLIQTGDPTGLARIGDLPSEIEIRVKGRERDIELIDEDKLIYNIDVSNITEPEVYTYRIYKRKIDAVLPRDVIVTSIEPSQISIEFEELIEQEVGVEVVTVGQPAPGHDLDPARIVTDPKTVVIQGPRSVVGALVSLPTEPLDVNGRRGNIQVEVGLDTTGRPIVVKGVSLISVLIQIEPRMAAVELEDLPIEVINTELKFGVEPPQLSVKIEGPQIDIERLNPGDVRLVIDGNGLERGSYLLRPKLMIQLPADAVGGVKGPDKFEQVKVKLH